MRGGSTLCKDLLKIYLCIYFRLCWVFTAGSRLAFFTASGGCSLVATPGLLMRWPLRGPRAPGHVGFGSCSSWALAHRLSSRSAWTHLFHSMWDLPDSGIEPVSPALAGRFFTTEPPAKPCVWAFNCLKMISKIMLFVMKSPGAVRACEQRRKEGQASRPPACLPWALPLLQVREGPAPPCLEAASGHAGQGRWGHSSGRGTRRPRGVKAKGMRTVPGFGARTAFLSSLRP